MAFNRSIYDPATGADSPRQQINEITAWIDASSVYGSDAERAEANLLPFNTDGLPNAGGSSDVLFVAGDPRANEQVGLSVMHTLFVREHNRLADQIAADNPQLTGEGIYQRARPLVGAMLQAITYHHRHPSPPSARGTGAGAAIRWQGTGGRALGRRLVAEDSARLDRRRWRSVHGADRTFTALSRGTARAVASGQSAARA